ncbi:hypothetical protein H4582DRAFT_2014625 [Lactarius indigo]|nr:hypothetical protein H4582DRAFT_2014625 [Lactarius indigo]
MPTRSTRKFPSTSEATCPDCGTTLSRGSDMKRHRNTQHPDGTEVKVHCPHAGCTYKTDQKSNLKAHINARHSNENHYPCPECNKYFSDPSQALKKAKKALKAKRKSGKKVSNEIRDQRAIPHNAQNASSNTLTNATYHDDFWKQIVDVTRCHASEPKDPQDVQINVPVAAAPAWGAPKTLDSNSGLSLSEQTSLPLSTALIRDGTYSLAPNRTPPCSPKVKLWPNCGHRTVKRDLVATIRLPPLRTRLPYIESAYIFAHAESFTFPTTSTAPSSSRVSGYQFVPPIHMATPPLEPVPALSWPSSLSPTNSTPLSQPEFFTSEPERGFNSWCQSYNFASEL